ncbi:thiamine phosphate synthase [Bacillus rubiinfantis]|uniref:thiamine phosphate synthase n=1 Tax=Bacillus rubiinfantis TaxID=1499680 RepID=UPI0005AB4051|nr:thiamine phosphate synthase [Bacillus rubiinfantis]
MIDMRDALKLYFIAGSLNCKRNLLEVLKEAINGGITMFQFREKGEQALTGTQRYMLAKQVQRVCQLRQIPFIVNDDIEMALALEADGVHIGQEDAPAAVVREKIGQKILGVSVHTMVEANAAMQAGADYLGIGPIFHTNTKSDAKPVQGTRLIEQLRGAGITIPIVGIGGITSENASRVVAAGADGVSVITAISQAASPLDAARELKKEVCRYEKHV